MHGQYTSRHPPGLPSDFAEHGLANIFTRFYFERACTNLRGRGLACLRIKGKSHSALG